MINRVDRKRPSAVLEDRLEINRIVDQDSSALSYLQLGTGHVKFEHEGANLINPKLNSNEIPTIHAIATSKTKVPCHSEKHISNEKTII